MKNCFKNLKKENIKKLSVFGSTVRGNSKIDSDIDMLVEFDGTLTYSN
ncbi:MAG: nucleotidyltransferase family protein [Fusobacteriaceae bacterium]